jgi:hypothetical protein
VRNVTAARKARWSGRPAGRVWLVRRGRRRAVLVGPLPASAGWSRRRRGRGTARRWRQRIPRGTGRRAAAGPAAGRWWRCGPPRWLRSGHSPGRSWCRRRRGEGNAARFEPVRPTRRVAHSASAWGGSACLPRNAIRVTIRATASTSPTSTITYWTPYRAGRGTGSSARCGMSSSSCRPTQVTRRTTRQSTPPTPPSYQLAPRTPWTRCSRPASAMAHRSPPRSTSTSCAPW